MKATLKQLSQGAVLCGAPIGGGPPSNTLGASASNEIMPLALALAAFLGAGVWMFRRWGRSPAPRTPEATPEAQQKRGLATT